jgi:hypothetical protein
MTTLSDLALATWFRLKNLDAAFIAHVVANPLPEEREEEFNQDYADNQQGWAEASY